MVASTSFHQLLYRLLRPRLEPGNLPMCGPAKRPLAGQIIDFQAQKAFFSGQEPGQNPRRQRGDEPARAPPVDERGR